MAYLKHGLASASVWKYSDDWYTPPVFVSQFGAFDLDPCAGPISKHARRNIRPPRDGLKAKWSGRVWCNPPFSTLDEWKERFVEHGNGLLLLNARPETRWFQSLVARCDAVFIPRGRIRFIRPDGSKPGVNIVGQAIFAIGPQNVSSLYESGIPGIVLKGDLQEAA